MNLGKELPDMSGEVNESRKSSTEPKPKSCETYLERSRDPWEICHERSSDRSSDPRDIKVICLETSKEPRRFVWGDPAKVENMLGDISEKVKGAS